jgi:hypothetical protein
VQKLLTTLCHADEMSKGESRLVQERTCACLFMAGQVDSRPGIEAVAWQAVWRHDDWTLWRHKCMFQASDLLKCDMANFRKTHDHSWHNCVGEHFCLGCRPATDGSKLS